MRTRPCCVRVVALSNTPASPPAPIAFAPTFPTTVDESKKSSSGRRGIYWLANAGNEPPGAPGYNIPSCAGDGLVWRELGGDMNNPPALRPAGTAAFPITFVPEIAFLELKLGFLRAAADAAGAAHAMHDAMPDPVSLCDASLAQACAVGVRSPCSYAAVPGEIRPVPATRFNVFSQTGS